MLSGDKVAAIILILISAAVFLYGLLDMKNGGSVGPLGIGIAFAGVGLVLLLRGIGGSSDDK